MSPTTPSIAFQLDTSEPTLKIASMSESKPIDPNAHNRVSAADRGPGMDEPEHYTYARPEDRPAQRDVRLVDAVKAGDHAAARQLLAAAANVHQRAEQDWTPLNFAAGKGDLEMVRLLIEHGADVTVTGRDRRRPSAIARAANHAAVAQFLDDHEQKLGVWEDPATARRYCKAYYLRELARFPRWQAGRKNWSISAYWPDDVKAMLGKPLEADDVVFLHQDFSVTRSMWHGEHVIFEDPGPDWVAFCTESLQFAIPSDMR